MIFTGLLRQPGFLFAYLESGTVLFSNFSPLELRTDRHTILRDDSQ